MSVLWAALDIHPDTVFAELRRREKFYRIAEKLPKLSVAQGSGK